MNFSVIIPVYGEADSLIELSDRIFNTFNSIGKDKDFEIFFVDDCSTDSSRDILKRLCRERPYVKSILLRRNSGKSFALMAGFLYSNSDFVITMDGDLQDSPEEIPKLIDKINEGYDLVSGWRKKRQDSWVRVLGSRMFNWIVSSLGDLQIHDVNCCFKIYRAEVIKNIFIYGQYHRFLPLLVSYLGFKVTEIPVSHNKRKYGISKYPALRFYGFFDLLSILFIYKYRFSPFYFFGTIGLCLIVPGLTMISFLGGRHVFYLLGFGEKYILFNRPLFALASTFCIIGLNIALTGFICDFILHHIGKKDIADLIKSNIAEIL